MKANRFVLLLVLILPGQVIAKLNDYVFEFGILEITPEKTLIVKEKTRRIPLITKDKGFLFGFIIQKIDGGNFNGQLVVQFPSKPKELTGKAKNINIDQNKTLKYPISKHTNYWTEASWFDEGDPIGIWKYTIFINGRIFREVEFEVTP